MTVLFTPNVGLAKPDNNEIAENWAAATKLCEDNNLILIDKTDITTTSYTPSLIAQTTNPNIGQGSILGQYQDIEGFILGSFVIIFVDAGVAAGSGEYGISLPFPAHATFHTVGTALNNSTGTNSCIGEGFIRDNSTVNNSGTVALDVVTVAGVSYARLITETFAGKTNRVFTNTMPFIVANADSLAGSFFYRRA